MTKTCKTCTQDKHVSEFNKSSSGGHQFQCKPCQKGYNARRYRDRKALQFDRPEVKRCHVCRFDKPSNEFQNDANSPDGLAATCRRCRRSQEYRRKYGITIEEYDIMYREQNGRCLVCKETSQKALAVDHCHSTGKVRGLLCSNCNTAIGLLNDDTARLRAAIKYLEESEE